MPRDIQSIKHFLLQEQHAENRSSQISDSSKVAIWFMNSKAQKYYGHLIYTCINFINICIYISEIHTCVYTYPYKYYIYTHIYRCSHKLSKSRHYILKLQCVGICLSKTYQWDSQGFFRERFLLRRQRFYSSALLLGYYYH